MHFVSKRSPGSGGNGNNYSKELADSSGNSRNWKGIAISLLVIVVVFVFVIVAAIIKQQNKGVHLEQKAFSIDDILDKRFDPKRFNGVWINNHQFTYLSEQLNIIKFDCRTQSQSTLLSNNTVKTLVGDKFKYFASGDVNVLLFAYDMKQVFRHSIVSRYKLYNIMSNMSFDVVPPNIYATDQIQNAQLSPDSRKLAFVYQNNIFLKQKFFDGIQESIQITNDGLELTVYNGITDWLYEEEILYQTNAMWWSPNSKNLAYMKFNDSNVEYFIYPTYDGTPYTFLNKVRYPKPDTPNPVVKTLVYQTEFDQTIELRVPRIVTESYGDFYVWNVKWLSDDAILIIYVNRKQNSAIIAKNDATNGQVLMSKEYPSPPSKDSDPWFLPSGLMTSSRINYFFQIWPFQGYRNIISFDSRNGESHAITAHHFDVSDLVFFNEKTTTIYYLATNGDPKQRHLFKKNVMDESSSPKCLTCNSSVEYPVEDPSKNAVRLNNSENCLYYSATFSAEGEYYVLECLGDKIPVVYLKSENKPSLEYVLESNDELKQLLASRFLPRKGYLRVTLNESANQYADAEMLYPNNFDPNENIYPVLVYLYNGPSSQTVDFQFRVRKFETFVCINFGVIVAVIDGRGTDFNGDKYLKAVSKRLGEFEIADQLTLINRLKKEIYTDDDRFSIWGWSYGGYLAAAALFQENSPFKCAISGAPVTDWMYYDTAYTERYLGSYADNRDAYERANLSSLAKRNGHHLNRKKMLLIHGTGDDNVHFQNSAQLAKVLRTTKLDFEFEVYPDVQHTPDDDTQRHLYQKLSRFLLTCYNMNYQQFYEQLNYHHLIGELLTPNKEEEKD